MTTTIQRSAAPVTEANVEEFERLLKSLLPIEYRAFLLKHNGGKPRKTRFAYTNTKNQRKPAGVAWLHSLGREQLDEPDRLDLEAAHATRPANFPPGVCIVGEAETDIKSGFIGLVCVGSDVGQVVFCTEGKNEQYTLAAVAPNWTSFLASLAYDEKPKEWHDHIWNRDEAQFRAWATTRRRRWKDDVLLEQDIHRALVEENFWAGVAVMLELGSERTDLFREAMNQNRFTLVGKLLDAGSVQASAIHDALVGSALLMHQTFLVERLLGVDGVDLDAQSDSGDTALHKAVEFRGGDVVNLLLARGANPTLVNDDDRTPAGIARRLEETQLLSVLLDAEKSWLAKHPQDNGAKAFDLAGVSIKGAGKPLTLDAIHEFEKQLKLDFPPEYRWLLLQHNGGTPNPRVLPISPTHGQEDEDFEEDDEEHDDDSDPQPTVQFLPLRKSDSLPNSEPTEDDEEEVWSYSVEEAKGWYHDGSEIPRGMVPIGSLSNFGCEDHGFLLLNCVGKYKGKLYTFDHNEAELGVDLQGLFAMLAEEGRKPAPPTDRFADAVAARDLNAVYAVLAEPKVKINWCSRDGRLPIRTACESGFDEAIMAVARTKAHEIDQLVNEAASADRIYLVRDLFSIGMKIKPETRRELTGYPALYRDPQLLPYILGEDKLQKLATGKRSHELLFSAARSGSTEAVRLMLGRGCNITATDDQGQTVLHQLFWGNMGDPAEMVAFLIGQGAKLRQADCNGQTALHLAMQSGNAVAAKLLIDAGEDLHARYELYPEGSPADREKAARMAARMAKTIEREFEKLANDLDELDDDDQPDIDTSEIAGEKAEKALDALGGLQQGLGQLHETLGNKVNEKLEEMSRGSWGRGPSALEAAQRRPDLPVGFIAEIEAHAKKQSGGKPD